VKKLVQRIPRVPSSGLVRRVCVFFRIPGLYRVYHHLDLRSGAMGFCTNILLVLTSFVVTSFW